MLSDETAQNLKRFVQAGGVLVVTPRSGVKDVLNAVVDRRLPGLLSELCGVEVDEYDSLPPGAQNPLVFLLAELKSSDPVPGTVWCDLLEPYSAQVIAATPETTMRAAQPLR